MGIYHTLALRVNVTYHSVPQQWALPLVKRIWQSMNSSDGTPRCMSCRAAAASPSQELVPVVDDYAGGVVIDLVKALDEAMWEFAHYVTMRQAIALLFAVWVGSAWLCAQWRQLLCVDRDVR